MENNRKRSSSSGNKSPAESQKGPDEEELKMLRARFRSRFQSYASKVSKNQPNAVDKSGQVKVKAAKKRSKTPEPMQEVDDGSTPTVFEHVKGGLRPAKASLRQHNIFRKPVKSKSKTESSSETKSDELNKKTKTPKSKGKDTISESDSSAKEKKSISPVKMQASSTSQEQKVKQSKTQKPKSDAKKEKVPALVETKSKANKKQMPEASPKTPDTSKFSSSATTSDANTPPQKQLGEYKGKRALFERMGDEIVLDDKVLQDIADDIDKGVQHNPEIIDPNLASQLVEIKKNQVAFSDADLKEITEQPFEVNEVANRVVEALTSHDVLGRVLTADELKMLSDYFNGERKQDEELLQVLNVALEKILDRANEFYANREELKSFLENRDHAKMLLLDALLSRKSNFLGQLYSNAFFYADVVRKTMSSAYNTVSTAYNVANVVAGQSMTAATDGVAYATDAAKGLAQRSQEYVTTARDMGLDLMGSAKTAADYAQSWTAISSPSSTNSSSGVLKEKVQRSSVSKSLCSTNDAKNPAVQEHWLATLWKVMCALGHLPYAFFEPLEETSEKRTVSNGNKETLGHKK